MKFAGIAAVLFIVGCASSRVLYTEEMLPDGKTWRIHILEPLCNKGAEACNKRTSELIDQRARELCGKLPERVFACSIAYVGSGRIDDACYVECPK